VNFEELDYQRTAIGELILRRRRALEVDGHVVEFENPIQDKTAANGVYAAKVEKGP